MSTVDTQDAPLRGATVLMSGGSRGIGLACALRIARDGANIVLLAKTDEPHPRLEGTVHTAAAAIREAGGQAVAVVGDVRRDDDIEHAVETAVADFGGIDVVINNASAIDLSRSVALEPSRYDLMQDINTRGTFMLTRAAMPHLLLSEHRRVVSMSPPINLNPRWLGAHTGYTMAKYGMTLATLGIGAEFAEQGVVASTLWPRTTIDTAAVRNVLGGDKLARLSRTPEIYADAAYEVLTSWPAAVAGRSLIVEDVLEAAGVSDFSTYAAVPGTPDFELYPDVFLD